MKKSREWCVGHSLKDGYFLSVYDLDWRYFLVDKFVEAVMSILGHPCCGKGPLGWIPFIDIVWFMWINVPNPLWRYNTQVIQIPLTEEQARTISPGFGSWLDEDYDD